jgi:hypothetical protein
MRVEASLTALLRPPDLCDAVSCREGWKGVGMGSRRCTLRALVHAVQRGSHTDRDYSGLIIILLGGILFVLAGILFVLLVGRDTAISIGRDLAILVMGGAFGVALVVARLRCSSVKYVASVGRSAVAVSPHSMARIHWSSCGSWPCCSPFFRQCLRRPS